MTKYKTKVITYGNIWTREIKMNKDDIKAGHKHEFDHLHFLSQGSIHIRIFDNINRNNIIFEKNYTAPEWIKVPKEHFHDIVALEDNTLGYCIQALANPEGNVSKTDYANDEDWMEEVRKFEHLNGLLDETLK